jgi:hypothetical protein
MGRKTKLTPEVQNKIIKGLLTGLTIEVACGCAGIHFDSYYEWLNRAKREPDSIFAEFSEAVKEAQNECELNLLRMIVVDESWQSKAWIMERRFGKRWAKNESRTNETDMKLNINFSVKEKDDETERE